MSIWSKIRNSVHEIKELGILGSATGITSIVGAIFWLILASLSSPEDYGRIGYYIAIAVIASRIALIGGPNTIMVYSARDEKIHGPLYVISLSGAVLISIILYFGFLLDLSISIYVIGFVLFTLVISELLAKKRFTKYAMIIVSQKIILLILSLSLYHFYGVNGAILGMGISFLPYIIFIIRDIKKDKIEFVLIKKRWKFILNSYFIDLGIALDGTLDKIIILPILGLTLLGNYQLGMQIFSILTIIPAMFFQYLLPRDSRKESNENLKKILIIFSIILAISGSLLGPIIIPMIYPHISESVLVIQIVSFAVIPYTLIMIYMSRFLGSEKSTVVFIGSIVFIVTQIPVIIILGETLGLVGVSISVLIAYSTQTIFLAIISTTRYSKKIS